MRKFLFLLSVRVALVPTMGGAQAPGAPADHNRSDNLNFYAYCHFSGGLSIVSADRIPGRGLRERTVETPEGQRKVSMLDGYRLLLGQPGRTYFANIHVEESDAPQYLADEDAVIKSFGALASPSGARMVTAHRDYNGFDMYSSDNSSMKGNGPTGMYVLFRDSAHLIVTIYFLDQRPEDRQFKTLEEYDGLRDGVLKDFTACANGPAGKPRMRQAALPLGTRLLVDSFDSVSQWTTNPSQGVEIAVHPDSGRNGRGMRVDFDFHGHTGYGIVHRRLDLDMPANYEFAFAVRGSAPSNTLEFKLVDPTFENVWWSRNPDFIFSPEWTTVARKKREICYAWGPIGGGDIRRLAGIEFAVTAGTGGKGSIWIDDLTITALDPDSPFDAIAPVASMPLVGTWESAAVSDVGTTSTLDFAADGSAAATIGRSMNFAYRVADGRLTTTVKDPRSGKSEVHTGLVHIEHDSLTQREENGPGSDVPMKRVRPAKAGDDPILGAWSYLDDSGATAFVDFGSNGQGRFRLPMRSCSGKWTTSGAHLTVSLSGQVLTEWDYSIKNGVLTTKDVQGGEAKYNRRTPSQ